MNPLRTVHWICPRGGRLLDSLLEIPDLESAGHSALLADRLADLLALGAIYHNHRRVPNDNIAVGRGDYLRVHLEPRRFEIPSPDARSFVVDETVDYLIVNKPAGLPVHPSLDNARENVVCWLEQRLQISLYVTQRLDIPTTGLLVLAKTKRFQTRFNRWLDERKVKKEYRALAARPVDQGLLIHYQKPTPCAPKEVSRFPTDGWLRCELEILECRPYGPAFEFDLRLHTGRTHQIRCQLADSEAPIIGDALYDGRKGHPLRIALQSKGLSFPDSRAEWSLERPAHWTTESFT